MTASDATQDEQHVGGCNAGCSDGGHLLLALLTASDVEAIAPAVVFVDTDGERSIRIRTTAEVVLAVERIIAEHLGGGDRG